MDHKLKTKLYKADVKALNKLLNIFDPLGVLPFDDGPEDEYECCTGVVLSCLLKDAKKNNLYDVLKVQLVKHWGLTSNRNFTLKLADTILTWWQSESELRKNLNNT